VAGPLWLGPLHDRELVGDCRRELELMRSGLSAGEECERGARRLDRWLSLALDESEAPPFFYDVDRLSSFLGVSPPKMASLGDGFRERGLCFCRTTFTPTGFKTDGAYEDVLGVMRSCAGGL
jgi:tRNA G26 N,N-dimethylase Trm1